MDDWIDDDVYYDDVYHDDSDEDDSIYDDDIHGDGAEHALDDDFDYATFLEVEFGDRKTTALNPVWFWTAVVVLVAFAAPIFLTMIAGLF